VSRTTVYSVRISTKIESVWEMGPQIEEAGENCTNEELHKLYLSINVIRVIK